MLVNSIIRGPAVIYYGVTGAQQTFYTEDSIRLGITLAETPYSNAQYGRMGSRTFEVQVEVTATPNGIWAAGTEFAARAAMLWPHVSTTYFGGGIFPTTKATQRELVIWSISEGVKYTFHNSSVTKMPQLVLSGMKLMAGSCTWTCLRSLTSGNALAPWSSTGDLIYTKSSEDFAASGHPNSSGDELFDIYTAAWGSITGFTGMEAEEAFVFDFGAGLTPKQTDAYGIYDYQIDDVTASCKFVPAVGPTMDQILTALKIQGSGSARGATLQSLNSATSLIVSGSTSGRPKITLTGAQIVGLPATYGVTDNRIGEVTFESSRTFGGSALVTPVALASIGVV